MWYSDNMEILVENGWFEIHGWKWNSYLCDPRFSTRCRASALSKFYSFVFESFIFVCWKLIFVCLLFSYLCIEFYLYFSYVCVWNSYLCDPRICMHCVVSFIFVHLKVSYLLLYDFHICAFEIHICVTPDYPRVGARRLFESCGLCSLFLPPSSHLLFIIVMTVNIIIIIKNIIRIVIMVIIIIAIWNIRSAGFTPSKKALSDPIFT